MTLPPVVDLRSRVAQVFNQGNLGSCTANACAALVEFVDKADGSDAFWAPSRLFIYYNTRVIENTVSWDSGATIRDSIKSVVQWGFIPESVWPYDITKYKKKPTSAMYKQALTERVTKYERVQQDAAHLQARLAQGYPIEFGFSVPASFMT